MRTKLGIVTVLAAIASLTWTPPVHAGGEQFSAATAADVLRPLFGASGVRAASAASDPHDATRSDALGDTRDIGTGAVVTEPRGDMSAFTVRYTANRIAVTVTIPGGEDPNTS